MNYTQSMLLMGVMFCMPVIEACAETVAGVTVTVPDKRDPMKWPFSEKSIWNTPIGKNAEYVPANLPTDPRGDPWAMMPQVDTDIIVMRPAAPLVSITKSSAAWSGANRCEPDGAEAEVLAQVPIPDDYVVPHSNRNNSATFLSNDGHTLLQSQPFTRCRSGSGATALLKFDPVDLYGEGRGGAHGGSRLSAIGGTLRIGELRPGGQPPRHVLKVDVDTELVMRRCSSRSECYRWPAFSADSNAARPNGYGTKASGDNPAAMKMGALLAIPANIDLTKIGLETAPAKMLAWTLQNYGAYVVDSTGGASFAIAVEDGPDGSMRSQFQSDWGFSIEQRVRDNTPWMRDMQRLVALLNIVDNNSAANPGGGGTPRQPLAPHIEPPRGD